MLPSKYVATVFVAILALQVFATSATAQLTPTGADILVEKVDIADFQRPRVANVPQHINITVKNQGDATFSSATGWQIFVGLNGKTTAACIEPGEDADAPPPPPSFASPCFIRMVPGTSQSPDGTNQSQIPARSSARYTLMWNATDSDYRLYGENAWIWVEILPLGASPGGAASECNGPDGSSATGRCQNNQYNLTGVRIGHLGVRSVPKREPPRPDANVNAAWRRDEIVDGCPIAPAIIQKGCRAKPGRSMVAIYEVTNVGTVDDSFVPSLIGNPSYYDRYGYTFDFAPRVVSLSKGAKQEVRVTIFVPENATALDPNNPVPNANQTNVDIVSERIRWTSTRLASVGTDSLNNPGCELAEWKPFCVNPPLPSFFADFRRGYNVTSNETFWQVKAGVEQRFNITINNTGNADDTFNVSFDNSSRTVNDSWSPLIINPGVIQPGKTLNASVTLTPPRNATNTTYWFNVTIKSNGDRDGDARCKANEVFGDGVCTLRFAAHLAQTWEITGQSDAAYRVVPGETVTYNLGIKNHGNGYDNVSLELQSTVGGWETRLSNTTLPLTPFNSTPFTLTVTSPPNTIGTPPTEASFFVNATATGPIELPFQLHSKAVTESRITIISGPNVRIDAAANSSFVDPGETVNFTLTLTNTGNVADNFTIPTPERPSSWGVTVEPTSLELQPLQQGTIQVSLRAPQSAIVGEKASVLVTAKSTVDRTRQKQFTLEGRVSGPDFFVDSVRANASTPYSGDKLDITVSLGNNGNRGADRAVNLTVAFVKDGVEFAIANKTYAPFEIGAQRRVVETFSWDTTGIEGTGTLVARLDPKNEVKEIDDTAGSNERASELILRTFDIGFTTAVGLTARPGEEITYSEAPNVFTAIYRGNQPREPVIVRVTSENGWLAPDYRAEETIDLVRATPQIIKPKLAIPVLPGVATDTLTVTLTPVNRPTEILRATTVTSLTDEEKPLVKSIVITPASATLGSPVIIEATIVDATGVTAATAYVTLPTNETTAVTLLKGPTGLWSANRTFTVPGAYSVTAEATDGAKSPNRNTTRETVGLFTMVPGSAPTIRLAPGQSATVRAGTPIRLDISDPAAIGKATYSIKGVSYDLKSPGFQIDTSTFPAGNIDVIVTAENTYGVKTSQTFRFIVDNTPGEITKVTMSPERPRANAEVTLAIQTASEVEAVSILVKRDGQVVDTLNATRRGVGSFEVKFVTPEGDYRLDVTARDPAGNVKLAESAVVFSAKPANPFGIPGPGAFLVLAAVASLALALRARRR